jgi:hypothetical protein
LFIGKVFVVGIFEDNSGKCHNSTLKVDENVILYLERKANGDLVVKFENDPGYITDELTVCGLEKPKLVTGMT